jgi:nitrite reductase (NADH) small subunit
MAEHPIGHVSDFKDGDKKVFIVDGIEVGIFQLGGTFYAWRNICPHQGGPVCQGRIFRRVVQDVDAEGKVHGRRYNENIRHIVCPWHGGEFDIRSGYHAGTNSLALNSIQTTIRNGEVFLRVD